MYNAKCSDLSRASENVRTSFFNALTRQSRIGPASGFRGVSSSLSLAIQRHGHTSGQSCECLRNLKIDATSAFPFSSRAAELIQ